MSAEKWKRHSEKLSYLDWVTVSHSASPQCSAHWAKNRVQRVLVPCYESKPFQRFLLQILAIFSWNFERFLKNALILSIFELEKCSFFLNRSEFRQKKIGAVISTLMAAFCHRWRQFLLTFMFLLIWSHGGSVCSGGVFIINSGASI